MITTLTGRNQVTVPAKLEQALHPEAGLGWLIGADRTFFGKHIASGKEFTGSIAGPGRRLLTSIKEPVGELISERGTEDE